jgi:WS/DGAT/MGAT family acyltransferase
MSQPTLKHRLSTLDATFLYYERKAAPFHVGSTMVLDGEISFEEFKAMLASKLPLLPRYMQKVVPAPFNLGHPTWEFDPDFDINRHIFRLELDPPGTMEQLRILSTQLLSKMLDRSKPLWEIYLVYGLEGKRTAIISKVHHSMADGIASVEIMNLSFDQSPNPPPPPKPEAITPPRRSARTLAGRWLEDWLESTEETLRNWNELQRGLIEVGQAMLKNPGSPITKPSFNPLITLTTPVSLLPFNKTNSGQLDITWDEFSFGQAHAIKDALGGTVNDVMLTLVTGAIIRYMEHHGHKTEGNFLRFMVPVNMRHEEHGESMGNRISVLPVEIPLSLSNSQERYAYVVKSTKEMKEAMVAERFNLLVNLIGTIPPALQALAGSVIFTEVPLVNMVCTNVPGPHTPLYILGKKLLATYPYVPFAYAVGLTCTIFSYDHKLFISLSSDAKKMPGIGQEFMQYLDQTFAELCEAAGVFRAKAPVAAKPVAKVIEPVVEAVKPVAEAAKPKVEEVVKPAAKTAKPKAPAAKPKAEAVKPAAKVVALVAEVVAPEAEAVEMVVEVPVEIIEPVSTVVAQPVTEVAEPEPVVPELRVEAAEPVVAVTESTAEVVEPVTGTVEFVLLPSEPAVEIVEPAFEAPEPAIAVPEIKAAAQTAKSRKKKPSSKLGQVKPEPGVKTDDV